MKQLATWIVSALLFAAIGGFSVWTFMHTGETEAEHAGQATETAPSSEPAEPPVVSRDKTGAVVVRLEPEVQERVGLKTSPLAVATDQPEVVAYGMVQEDPDEAFTVRAPLAGTIATGKAGRWVSLGEAVTADAVVGGLVPRLTPLEQADLASKLAAARAEVQGAMASLESLRASLESKQKLTSGDQKIVSEQALKDAESKVKGEQARLEGARETVRVLEQYVSRAGKPADMIPLKPGRAGRVVEVQVQPGENVEPGQPLLKLASYDRLLVRVSLPAGESIDQPGVTRIIVANDERHSYPATDVSSVAAADAVTGGQTFILAFKPNQAIVQPGMPATAHIKVAGEPAKGVLVPASAVIRYVGAAWVYVKDSDETFVRREIPLTRMRERGWFVPAGTLSPGEQVVVQAAESLLSHELKHQAGGGGEEEE